MGIKGEKTRQKIIQAATEVFAARGLAGASMSNIASSASIAKSHIYLYFDSKEELYNTVVKDFTVKLDFFVERRKNELISGAIEQRMHNLVCVYMEFLCRNRLYKAISRWDMASGNYYTVVDPNGSFVSIFELFSRVISEGQENKIFCRSVDPTEAILVINHLCLVPCICEDEHDLSGNRWEAVTHCTKLATLCCIISELCLKLLMV